MKIHRPLAEAIAHALVDIFVENKYADKVLERSFKQNKKWGARDRRFIAEAVYDCVRWWRRLHFALGASGEFQKDLSWKYLAGWLCLKDIDLPQWPEFQQFAKSEFLKNWESPSSRAIQESIPDWLDEKGVTELGEEKWSECIAAMNHQAPAFLRTNELKVERSQLINDLAQEEVNVEPVGDWGLRLQKRKNVFVTKAFKAGAFEMQDIGSQEIAPFLKPEPGHRVVDACAGAGGKTLHLAALMKNKGKIIALDIHEWKLKELKRRCARAGVDIVETRPIVGSKVIKRLHESAERVLLDVPCSGVGVLRRNPDSKWKLSQAEINELNETQMQILTSYSKILKKGGLLVYATCSVFPSENSKIVNSFLASNESEWSLEEERTLWPTQNGSDGFYMARLSRK